MKTLLTTTSLLALLGLGAPAHAQPATDPSDPPVATSREAAPEAAVVDPLTVTASRSGAALPASLTGSSVTVIDAQALQERQTRIVSDVLRDVPGVAVSRSGGVGGFTQVRIRGAESNHTLVLIDGIEASDPFLGEFDFATLIADDVARVEVLRGQQSAIYGSDAIGGVIHYITASGRERQGLSGRTEAGSSGTYNGALRYGGVSGAFDYAVSGAWNRTNGTPAARAGIGDKDLDAENGAAAIKLGWQALPNLRLSAVGRYSHTDAQTDPQDFDFGSPTYGFVVDPRGDDGFTSRAWYGLVRGELSLLEGRWTQAATAQINDNRQDVREAGAVTSANTGRRTKASYDSTFRFGPQRFASSITLAADFEREDFRNIAVGGAAPTVANFKRKIDNTGVVAEYDLRAFDRFSFGAAVRHDENDRFQDADTYRLRGAFEATPALTLRAAAGSGIKAPTNFELFGFDPRSFVGNPNLKPERSEGWEAGADLKLLKDRVKLGFSYFDSELTDEIYTVFSPTFVSSPANRATLSKQHGVELFANAVLDGGWRIDLAYTYLDATENGLEEVRRAPHIASASLSWRPEGGRVGATLTVRYNGDQLDNNFTNLPLGPRVTLPEFWLVNLAGDYRLTDRVELYGRVENLFDQRYEEVFTTRAPGVAAYAGVRFRL